MPKKLQTNQKAADARARKDAVKQAEKERIQKVKEDEYWKDDDRQLAKKLARKEERERKEAEERERRKEREKLLQEEMAAIKGKDNSENKASTKMTRSQIEKNLSNVATTAKVLKDSRIVEQDLSTIENLNRVPDVTSAARTVDEAIHLMANLTVAGDVEFDRHPERRLKAAWDAFESARLPVLKAENPNLRLSQLRQMVRKEWQKAPENPLNARLLAYNAKKAQLAEQAED